MAVKTERERVGVDLHLYRVHILFSLMLFSCMLHQLPLLKLSVYVTYFSL